MLSTCPRRLYDCSCYYDNTFTDLKLINNCLIIPVTVCHSHANLVLAHV